MGADSRTVTIDVTVGPGINCADHDGLRNAVSEAIAEHVRAREGLVRNLGVKATIIECNCAPGRASFAVDLDGQINGKPVTRKVRAVRSPGKLRGAGVGTALGLGAVVNVIVVGLASGVFGAGDDAENLSQCFAECMAELCLTIDSSIGHQESTASKTWNAIALSRWIAAAAMLALVTMLFMMQRGYAGAAAAVIPGMLLATSIFWLVHVAGLAFMPTHFFLRDPRGKKAMALSGVKSVFALRIICAVLGVVFIAVVVGCVMMSIEMLSKTPTHAR